MEKITKELTESLTPLEKESAEWCYQRFQRWLDKNKKNEEKDKNLVTIAHMVCFKAYHFQPGELEAFKSLHEKGIIWDIIPYDEMDEEDAQECKDLGNDVHEIVLDDTIVAVHILLTESSAAGQE